MLRFGHRLWLLTPILAAGCAAISPAPASSPPTVVTVEAAKPVALTKDKEKADKADRTRFGLTDVFELEWAADPRISPDGRQVVYQRRFMDKMRDVRRSHLWIIDADGRRHRPLVAGAADAFHPRWSPSGDRLAYAARVEKKVQIVIRWMDTGQTAAVTRLTESPSDIVWSPDGKTLAFSMQVRGKPASLVQLPTKPEGAKWAKPPKVIDQLFYRADGQGYLKPGFNHVFIVPAEGGTPRQITNGDYPHGRPAWSPDSRTVIVEADRNEDWAYRPRESNLWSVDVATGKMKQLTTKAGPDGSAAVSPNGKTIAFVGFEDRLLGYQAGDLQLLDRASGKITALLPKLDRSVRAFKWAPDGRGLYLLYDDHGQTKLAFTSLKGQLRTLADNIGGTSIGRPYASGSLTVARNGTYAVTVTDPSHPADVAVGRRGRPLTRLTRLNDDLFGSKALATLEEVNVKSSAGGLPVQGWILKPPGFDPKKKYPLILEIHGGPFANYGERFTAECQLYAAAGYVVLYVNPRGSTSYGADFANEIHHNYPNQDYDDLMSTVDAVIAKGFIDTDRLYVTGGSGGGVLTAWIVGKTDRFRAAVVAKPVINWFSFIFTADGGNFFSKYWFSGLPWEKPDEYIRRSPLFLAGNVKTPTMLLSGEADYRTPISEAEQFYLALKIRKVDTMLVRVPGASHLIARRPSHLIAKVAYILGWFEKHKPKPAKSGSEPAKG